MKAAIYARYSSDNQRDASIADQLRICPNSPPARAGRSSRSSRITQSPAQRCFVRVSRR